MSSNNLTLVIPIKKVSTEGILRQAQYLGSELNKLVKFGFIVPANDNGSGNGPDNIVA
ncbi:MAG: hypothetical protein PHE89_02750 [Alphaproteobacteria bacterium]|nr:hypothetical protein [Alphaproteobacteria bacterium]